MSRTKFYITIVIIILLIAVIVLALVSIFSNKKETPIPVILPPEDQNNIIAELPASQLGGDNVPVETPVIKELNEEEKTKGFLIRTASAFAERFGSYSNQSNYENLLDLKVLMTTRMQNWVDSIVAGKDSGSAPAVYYGITTRALNIDLKSFYDSEAEAVVSTQRLESVGAEANSRVYYQNLQIVFTKESGVWLVDEARWE